jgi:cytosine deaminase
MRSRGVRLHVVDSEECYRLMQDFIRDNGALWNEDIGE